MFSNAGARDENCLESSFAMSCDAGLSNELLECNDSITINCEHNCYNTSTPLGMDSLRHSCDHTRSDVAECFDEEVFQEVNDDEVQDGVPSCALHSSEVKIQGLSGLSTENEKFSNHSFCTALSTSHCGSTPGCDLHLTSDYETQSNLSCSPYVSPESQPGLIPTSPDLRSSRIENRRTRALQSAPSSAYPPLTYSAPSNDSGKLNCCV